MCGPHRSISRAWVPRNGNRAVDQHPPEVRMLALMEQLNTRLNANIDAVLDQIRELIICQAVEDAQRAKIINAHQIVAR